MIASLLVLLLASGPVQSRDFTPLDRTAVIRYSKTCAGKPATPACTALRLDAEAVLLDDLDILERGKAPVDRPTLRALAANAVSPALRVSALERLTVGGDLSKDDEALLIAAMKSRIPGERRVAFNAVGRLTDEKWARMLLRQYPSTTQSRANEYILALREQELPDVGTAAYPGAETVWFASGPERVFLVTADPVAKVTAFYAKGGKKIASKAEMQKAVDAAKNVDPAEIMRLAQTDPKKMEEMMRKMSSPDNAQTGGAADIGRFTQIEGDEGVTGVKYVVLEEQPFMMGKVPTKVVAVFTDAILGKTGIVFTLPKAQMTFGDPQSPDYSADIQLYQIVGRSPESLPPDSEEDALEE